MADFLTDDEMAALEKQQAPKSPDFLSDDEMAAMEARFAVGGPSAMTTPVEQMKITPEGLGRGALESLPFLGSIGGGLLAGGGSLGLGAAAGASLGAVGGKALEQAGKQFFFGEGPKTRAEQFGQLGEEAAYGALGELGGRAIGAGVKSAVEAAPSMIKKGAKKLGKVMANIPEEYTGRYVEAKGKIDAPPKTQILDDLSDLYNKAQSEVEKAATQKTLAQDQLNSLKSNIQDEFKTKRFDTKVALDEAKNKLGEKTMSLKEGLKKDIVTPLYEGVQSSLETLKKRLSELSRESYEILDKDPNRYSVRNGAKALERMAIELNIGGKKGTPITEESKALQRKILKLADNFKNTPETLSAPELKKIIQDLDRSAQANYNSLEFDTRVSQAYKMARGVIDDAIKAANPQYEAKMAELAPLTELYGQAVERFGSPTKAISRLKGVATPQGQAIDVDLLRMLGQSTGDDFITPVETYIKQQSVLKNPQALDALIKETPEFRALSEIENAYNTLKNPETEKALWQSPQWIEAEQRAGKAISGLEKAQEEAALFRGFSPMQVEAKYKGLTGARQYGPTELFEKVKETTGIDYAQQIRDRELLDQFSKASTQGSRKVVAGGAIGSAIGAGVAGPGGAAVGSALGGATGAYLDQYGGKVFKNILDTSMRAGERIAPIAEKLTPSAPTRDVLYRGLIQKYFEAPSGKMKEEKVEKRPDQGAYIDKVKGTPYEEILRRSLENGGEKSLQAANYVLMNRDPEYRKLINEEQEV